LFAWSFGFDVLEKKRGRKTLCFAVQYNLISSFLAVGTVFRSGHSSGRDGAPVFIGEYGALYRTEN
jgi:hypothetical protein